MSPPLREKWHQDVLWKGLAKNDLQVISTDHCPFCMHEQKELGKDDFSKIPNGAPGIETRLTLRPRRRRAPGPHQPQPLRRAVLDDAGEDVRPVSAQGDDRRRQRRRHRRLRPEPDSRRSASKTLHMRVDYNPYEGDGRAGIAVRGDREREGDHRRDKFVGKKGAGRFLTPRASLAATLEPV